MTKGYEAILSSLRQAENFGGDPTLANVFDQMACMPSALKILDAFQLNNGIFAAPVGDIDEPYLCVAKTTNGDEKIYVLVVPKQASGAEIFTALHGFRLDTKLKKLGAGIVAHIEGGLSDSLSTLLMGMLVQDGNEMALNILGLVEAEAAVKQAERSKVSGKPVNPFLPPPYFCEDTFEICASYIPNLRERIDKNAENLVQQIRKRSEDGKKYSFEQLDRQQDLKLMRDVFDSVVHNKNPEFDELFFDRFAGIFLEKDEDFLVKTRLRGPLNIGVIYKYAHIVANLSDCGIKGSYMSATKGRIFDERAIVHVVNRFMPQLRGLADEIRGQNFGR